VESKVKNSHNNKLNVLLLLRVLQLWNWLRRTMMKFSKLVSFSWTSTNLG